MKITREDLLPHLAMCREVLDPRKAGILGDRQAESLGISLNKEGSIRRVWSDLNEKYVYIFKAFLDFYTDALNVSDDGGNPSSCVTNPIIGDATNGKIEVPGTYRNAFTIVRPMADDRYMLIQELRLGFIQSLVSGTSVDYSEARIEGEDQFHGDGTNYDDRKFVSIVWKGVSPDASHQIVDSIDALDPDADFSSVTVNGNVLDGYGRLFVRAQEEADGSHSIRMMLAHPSLKYELFTSFGTSNQGTDYVYFGVRSDLVQSIINSEQAVGKSARVSPPDGMGLHTVTITSVDPDQESDLNTLIAKSCSEEVYQTAYYGVSKADADNITIPSTVPAGTSYRLRKQARGDGFWTVILEKIERGYQDTTLYTSEDSAGRKVTRRDQLGVTDEAAEDISQEPGYVKQQIIRLNPDCSKDIQTTKTQAKEQSGSDKRGTILYSVDGVITLNKDAAEQYTTPIQGITRRIVNQPNVDGSYNITAIDEESPVLSSEESISTVKKSSTGTGTRNKRGSKPVAPAPNVGEVVRHRVQENPDGTWDENTITEAAAEGLQAGGATENACDGALGTDVAYRNLTGAEVDDYLESARNDLVGGQRLVWSKRELEDGLWDLSYRIETAPQLESTSRVYRKYGTVTEDIKRNISSSDLRDPDSIQQVDGVTKTLRQDKNADCSWDEVYREENAPDTEGNSRIERRDVIATGVFKGASDTEEDLDDLDDDLNEIGEVTNRQNPDGSWQTNKVRKLPKAQSVTSSMTDWTGAQRHSCAFTNQTESGVDALKAQHQALGVTGAGYDYSIRSISIRENEYGLYDGTISVTPDPSRTTSSVGGTQTEKSSVWSIDVGEGENKVRWTVDTLVTPDVERGERHLENMSITKEKPGFVPSPSLNYIGRGKYKAVRISHQNVTVEGS